MQIQSSSLQHRKLLAVCAAILAIGAFTSQSGMAQGTPGIPIKHAETSSVEAVHFFAAQKSKDALILIVYGGDTALQQTALRAAAKAIAVGYPLRGVVYGPARSDARSAIEFYADAQLTATFLNPDGSDQNAIVSQLRRSFVEIVLPRRQRAG